MFYRNTILKVGLTVMLMLYSISQTPIYVSGSNPQKTQASTALPVAVSTTAGGSFTCALTNAGGVKCWGGDYGVTPEYISGLNSGITSITAGYDHVCALTDGGGAKCWGKNYNGQLGNGSDEDSLIPVDVIGLTSDVIFIDSGDSHTCAVTSTGGLKCWGDNYNGQLGNGTSNNESNVPVDVTGLSSGVTKVSAGRDHTCAIVNGGAKCWGSNSTGMLGDGTTTNSNTPVDVSGLLSGVNGIALGVFHSCALISGGGVKCWGGNYNGQLGDGTSENESNVPVDVTGLSSGVVAITASWSSWGHTCAITSVNGVKCWGGNKDGQIGDGTTTDRNTPTDVIGLSSGIENIESGGDHTCVLVGSDIQCWGTNENGQLGDGRLPYNLVATSVVGGDTFISLAPSSGNTCGLTDTGGVKCWGGNFMAWLDHTTPNTNSSPTDVSGLTSDVVAITSGHGHSCAVTTGGGVKCWGNNYDGQLGTGNDYMYTGVADVVGLTTGITAVSAGGFGHHTCALTIEGGVKCWGGYNRNGQLGDGTTTKSFVPVDVVGLSSGITKIAAGGFHVCALTNGGGVKCWGGNFAGQLGDGTNTQSTTPVDVSGLTSGVIAITAGEYHTCAITSSGGVKCWGDGNNLPADIAGLTSGATSITSGDDYTCIVLNSGVKCWGENGDGQLGDGTQTYRDSPVNVTGLASDVTAVYARYAHTCALTSSGSKCWGDNSYGQIGDGVPTYSSSPINATWVISSTSVSIPTSGGVVIFSVGATTLDFPSGTFTDTVNLTYTVPFFNDIPPSGDLLGIGHAFDIDATFSADGQQAQPTQPYTVTIQYTDFEKGPAIESTLSLYWWNGSQWVKESSSSVNVNTNTVTATPNHFSIWAVMGETLRVYLPVTQR
jgi:alpha-tubulin suppressor-like RCC1 family protein